MSEDNRKSSCLKFLREVKRRGKAIAGFEESLTILQDEAATKGLNDEDIDLIVDIITHADLGATKWISLIKCLIPKYKMSVVSVRQMMTWCLSSINTIAITVSTIIIQWIIGLCEYQLVDRKVVNAFYDVLFFTMLKKERLEKHIAQLIYMLSKPEDVTRRSVSRLLMLQQKYSQPQKHTIALLSLFKSYKPELVPEKIRSMNIESAWKPVPEILRLGFEDAKDRIEVQCSRSKQQEYFDWNTAKPTKSRRKKPPLVPSVGYFHFGSSIFKEKDAKSIFDVSCIEDLGKHHLSVDLPCNATSLLANTAGYHLLTYANFQYQRRFSYNLYNTLRRAFILESDKFSEEEMDRLLDMTIEFSRYMQQGILIINLFVDEYMHVNKGNHQAKLLLLMEWMMSLSIAELQEKVLIHIQNIFYESTLEMKCRIIRTIKNLIINFFINQGYDEHRQNAPSPFLGQVPIDNLEEVVPVLTKFTENLIVVGLNAHSYNVVFLSETLRFYEQICTLEARSRIAIWTLAPPAVIYGGFLTNSCAILSRICGLLLRYRSLNIHRRDIQVRVTFRDKLNMLSVYAQDIVTALQYKKPFSGRSEGYLLKSLSSKVIEDLDDCNLDFQLSIETHYAVLPHIWTLRKTGLNISTDEDALSVAQLYYPAVSDLLAAFKGEEYPDYDENNI